LQELGSGAFSAYGIAKDAGGVALIEVPKGSAAARAGFKTDDLILQINGRSVSKIGQICRLTEESGDHPLSLKIVRDMASMTLTLQP
jgi:S1-C subfamily serine protease